MMDILTKENWYDEIRKSKVVNYMLLSIARCCIGSVRSKIVTNTFGSIY